MITVLELTWQGMVETEPRLEALRQRIIGECRGHLTEDTFCGLDYWYGNGEWLGRGKKREMADLVGWGRRQEDALGSNVAYELATRILLQAIPPCKGKCGCM